MLVRVLVVAVASASAAFAPSPLARSALVRVESRPVVALRQLPPPRLARSPIAVASATAVSPPALPAFGGGLTRVLLAALVSFVCVFLRVGRAFAVERTMRASSPSLVSVALSGDVLKYAGLAALFGTAYAFRKEEKPILTETPDAEVEQPAGSERVPTGGTAAAVSSAPAADDDSMLFSSLTGRMKQLADERHAAEEALARGEDPTAAVEDNDKPPADSTDSWGTGDTAVLEPPRDDDKARGDGGLLDGPPAVNFPPGYPLVDGEVTEADVTPAASADDIAMLNRMFGTSE